MDSCGIKPTAFQAFEKGKAKLKRRLDKPSVRSNSSRPIRFVTVQPGSNSLRLPTGANGNISCTSLPGGEL